jgi:hypothetical protein
VADAVQANGASVWGVVFALSDSDLARLDVREGYKPGRLTNAYHREERRVLLRGDEAQSVVAWVYFAHREPSPPLPNTEYRNLILAGARRWRLPEEYIRALEGKRRLRSVQSSFCPKIAMFVLCPGLTFFSG